MQLEYIFEICHFFSNLYPISIIKHAMQLKKWNRRHFASELSGWLPFKCVSCTINDHYNITLCVHISIVYICGMRIICSTTVCLRQRLPVVSQIQTETRIRIQTHTQHMLRRTHSFAMRCMEFHSVYLRFKLHAFVYRRNTIIQSWMYYYINEYFISYIAALAIQKEFLGQLLEYIYIQGRSLGLLFLAESTVWKSSVFRNALPNVNIYSPEIRFKNSSKNYERIQKASDIFLIFIYSFENWRIFHYISGFLRAFERIG